MTVDLIHDVLIIARDCVGKMFASAGREGLKAMAIAIAVSALCYFLCHKSTKLWNRRFQVRLVHHLYCAASAVVGFTSVILYLGCPFLKVAALALILTWQEQLQLDKRWQVSTFDHAYDEVKKLGKESPEAFERSRKEDGLVPMSNPETLYKVASVYCNAASQHFAEARPFLSQLIRPNPEVPEEPVVQNVKEFFASQAARDTVKGGKKPYPLRRTTELVARLMSQDLEDQVPRLVTSARTLVLSVALFLEAAFFCGIGYAAYQDLKLRV